MRRTNYCCSPLIHWTSSVHLVILRALSVITLSQRKLPVSTVTQGLKLSDDSLASECTHPSHQMKRCPPENKELDAEWRETDRRACWFMFPLSCFGHQLLMGALIIKLVTLSTTEIPWYCFLTNTTMSLYDNVSFYCLFWITLDASKLWIHHRPQSCLILLPEPEAKY